MRGLAELLILQCIFETMEAVVANELGAAAQPLLPSNFLDLIDGTSTGGRVSRVTLPPSQPAACR